MADVTQLMLASSMTVAVNAVYAIQNGKNAVPGIVSGGITFAMLSFAGAIWRYDIVIALAYVMLLAALLKRGGPIIDGLTSLATGKKK